MQCDQTSQQSSPALRDRRRHRRYRFSTPITIRSADRQAVQGITIEISQSGMSAISAGSLTLNDTVELEPIAAGKVLAVVRRTVGRLYNFEFVNLPLAQSQRIAEICKTLPLYQGKALGI